MGTNCDKIELLLPFKAEYVSIARLTVSGISNRLGFDIEAIEDIKVAVAEVCNKLVGVGSSATSAYKVVFEVSREKLTIVFDCDDKKTLRCVFGDGDDELGISIINALMDEVELCPNSEYLLSMTKSLKGTN